MEIRGAWHSFWGGVWVPPELRQLREPVILHLSDTPTPFIGALPNLIRQVNPTWIVHTGDLVDDVKLGLNPAHLDSYTRRVRRLIGILEASHAEQITLCLGNHDDFETVAGAVSRCEVVSRSVRLQCGALTLGAAHYPLEAQATGGDFCLFGHDMTWRTRLDSSPRLLNGLEGIYIILAVSGTVYSLPYPAGTDDQRLGRGKLGL